jgi:hypothetical protein
MADLKQAAADAQDVLRQSMRDDGDLAEVTDPVSAVAMPQIDSVLKQVKAERIRQDDRFGWFRDYPDGTSRSTSYDWELTAAREALASAEKAGKLTWRHILQEEFFEVSFENDPARLKVELIQVAAVATAWAEAIERRPTKLKTIRPSIWRRFLNWARR